jgi:L-alanine-DL-glutamate epimerase-like enolase superfamily enzyme
VSGDAVQDEQVREEVDHVAGLKLAPHSDGFGLDRYIAEPLRIEAGCAIAPDRPGHGITFDWQGLDVIRA